MNKEHHGTSSLAPRPWPWPGRRAGGDKEAMAAGRRRNENVCKGYMFVVYVCAWCDALVPVQRNGNELELWCTCIRTTLADMLKVEFANPRSESPKNDFEV